MSACPRCAHHNDLRARFCVSCGLRLVDAPSSTVVGTPSSTPPARDILIGRQLGDRYRIVDVIGEGGMGKVYRAEQKMGNATRSVAIKVLHPRHGADPQLAARFSRECETVIQLHHPNTVRFFDFGETEDGLLYIAMEYIDGESLAEVIERGPLPAERAELLLEQICGSLHEAHRRGIIHRDLKPDNILLTQVDGAGDFVKVLDFGISKPVDTHDDASQLTQHGAVLGTPPYMSPEQFSGERLAATSDVYSLGVIAYEMLTGRLPFEARTPWQWAAQHLNAEPAVIDDRVTASAIEPSRKEAIMRALAKDPNARFQTAADFYEAFRIPPESGAPAGFSSGAPSMPTRGSLEPPPVRRRGIPWWAWATCIAGVLVAALGLARVGRQTGSSSVEGRPTPSSDNPDAAIDGHTRAQGDIGSAADSAIQSSDTGSPANSAVEDPNADRTDQDKSAFQFEAPSADPRPKGRTTKTPANRSADPKTDPQPKAPTTSANRRGRQSATQTRASTAAVSDGERAKSKIPGSKERRSESRSEPDAGKHTHETNRRPTRSNPRRNEDASEDIDESTDESGSNAAGEARAAAARRALRRGQVAEAIVAFRKARDILGPDNHSISRLERKLRRGGSNGVGLYIRRKQCKNAQSLYRDLRSVGLHDLASRHFDSENCPLP